MGQEGTGASLPIRVILNANPAQVRVNERGIDMLVHSIQERGLIQPILLARDNLVLDGGRRLKALERLGWDRIPVVVTEDWNTIVEYFKTGRDQAWKLGLPFESLTYQEFDEQVERRLRPIFELTRRQTIKKTRRVSLGSAPQPRNRNRVQRNRFNESISEMLDVPLSTVSTQRDILSFVHRCELADKALGIRANELLAKFEAQGGRLYSLHKLLGDMAQGKGESTRYRVFPNEVEIVGAPRPGRTALEPNPKLAKDQVAAAGRILELYEQLGELALEMGELNISVDPDTADDLVKRYRNAQRKVGVLRTYLDVNSRRESSA